MNRIYRTAVVIVSTLIICSCSKDKDKEPSDLSQNDPQDNAMVAPIAVPYEDILVIDVHNHDAANYTYVTSVSTWDWYAIDKIVLFGDISEPSAMQTDAIAFEAYRDDTSRYFPFIAGINIHNASCLTYIRERFEAGVFGIGEVVGASSYSPEASDLPWKGEHPLDGYFPEIYELCAEYNKPILLHLDPTSGLPITKLTEAATLYPGTNFIFAHTNAYNTPEGIEELLENYTNIYIDFFAGFTAYNQDSNNTLEDYVPLINAYPERFLISTDSGYGVGYDNAYAAIYELFDLLDHEVVVRIAGLNFLGLIGEN